MDPLPILVKALIDQLLKRLPSSADRTRLRVQDDLLRTLVDRNRELEGVADQFARIDAQTSLRASTRNAMACCARSSSCVFASANSKQKI